MGMGNLMIMLTLISKRLVKYCLSYQAVKAVAFLRSPDAFTSSVLFWISTGHFRPLKERFSILIGGTCVHLSSVFSRQIPRHSPPTLQVTTNLYWVKKTNGTFTFSHLKRMLAHIMRTIVYCNLRQKFLISVPPIRFQIKAIVAGQSNLGAWRLSINIWFYVPLVRLYQ